MNEAPRPAVFTPGGIDLGNLLARWACSDEPLGVATMRRAEAAEVRARLDRAGRDYLVLQFEDRAGSATVIAAGGPLPINGIEGRLVARGNYAGTMPARAAVSVALLRFDRRPRPAAALSAGWLALTQE